jgi:hypothetical protein
VKPFSTRIPWLLLGVAVASSIAVVVTVAIGEQQPRALAYVPSALAFVAVGAAITARHPRNPIGWVFCLSGLMWTLTFNVDSYARWAVFENEPAVAGGTFAAWISHWSWVPEMALPVVLALYLGTDGRLASPRWKLPFVAACAGLALLMIGTMFESDLALVGDELTVPNPWAVPELGWLIAVGGLLVLGSAVAGVVSLAQRLRRASRLERQQLKWVASAFVAAITAGALGAVLWAFAEWAFVLTVLGIAAVPIGVGVAILRYRLYDIEVVLRRTLVYGVLTAGLAGLYFAIVIVLQEIFSSFAGGSDLAIAGSTLAVAALFRPVRARLQALVDRRFFRRKYDAQQTLAAFSGRLRQQVDLEALSAELQRVVGDSMRPAHVSVWLNEAERR